MRGDHGARRVAVLRRIAGASAIASLFSIVGLAAQTPPPGPQVQQIVVGPNVNMVGGPASFEPGRDPALVGDPFLQRQNEPSLAVSSRNACHLLAGANDYRAVDLEEAVGETGDAWLGVFKSLDCGNSWTSTLLPGHPVDFSAAGLASPIRGLAAAADPTVRAGTSGLLYMSGIAFNRGDGEIGKVFVARFVDNNNKDGADPIRYLGTAQIDVGTSGQFLDKPWIATDIPRGGGQTCSVDGQTVPAGPVYIVYTIFVGGQSNVRTKIMFSKSDDCGATWSNPSKLSERFARNQGTAMAVDPGTGAIYITWREFAAASDAGTQDAILVARSADGGKSFTKAQRIEPTDPATGAPYVFRPFDQASSPVTFRTNAYPTIAVVPAEAEGRAAGAPGRAYVFWSARGFAPLRAGQQAGDARIVMASSLDGVTWTYPTPVDDFPGAGHQIMPAAAFAGGKLALAHHDLREDAAATYDDLIVEYGQQALMDCTASYGPLGFAAVLQCMAASPSVVNPTRHTLDLRSAMADAACLASASEPCAFTSYAVAGDTDGASAEVSQYLQAWVKARNARYQYQSNRPNLPLFSRGRLPFIGDYIDIAGQSYLSDGRGNWFWNTGRTVGRPAPVFHVSWGDNRDVLRPRPGGPGWESFTPAVLGPNAVACTDGQTGIRNQNVYTAQLKPGLVISAPLNAKKVVGFQRTFVVVVENTTAEDRLYSLTLAPPAGVIASFDQNAGFGTTAPVPLTELAARVPRRSSITRTVFVGLPPGSELPNVVVPVNVEETAVCGALGCTAVDVPDFDTVFLNPDFENPDFENPDFENQELHNPDFENPDFENPDFENPDFENPDFENPDFENPDFENPDFENPDFENPDFENPDFENPDFENPDFENPDFENPDFENPAVSGDVQITDVTWSIKNNGNTTSAYKANIYVKDPKAGVYYQLVVRRLYESPLAKQCSLGASAQNQSLVNIVAPDVQAALLDRNFNDPSRDNATFYLAPGEAGRITLRAYCSTTDVTSAGACPLDLVDANGVAMAVVAQALDCIACTGPDCPLVQTECIKPETEKEIYDPIPPDIALALVPPETTTVADGDNDGSEPIAFTLQATDNLAVIGVTCDWAGTPVAPSSVTGDLYHFSGAFPVGTTTVACTASDARPLPHGPNTAETTFDVTVTDVTAPVFDVTGNPGSPFTPGNPAEATGPDGAVVEYTTPSATDGNGGPVTVACAPLSGSTFPIGTTPVDCTATDEAGNSTDPTNLFDVTVADTTAPEVSIAGAPAGPVEGDVLGGTILTITASATDVVDGSLAASCDAPAVFPVGSTTVTCSATDGDGNTGTASVVVTVVDTTAPIVTLQGPAAVTIEAGTVFVDPGATATDIVDGDLATSVSGAVQTLVPGVYTLTYSATDASGNTGTAARTVTVVDTLPPTSLTASVNPTTLWPPNGAIIPVTASGSAIDGGSGVATLTWEVIDEYGTYQPTGSVSVAGNGPFSFQVPLLADRLGSDKDGRHYTIRITAVDRAGNSLVLAQPLVVNVHDQSGN